MKADGTLCGAYRVKGELLCPGHLGLGLAASPEAARAAAERSTANRQQQAAARQKERGRTYRDRLAEGLEQRAAMIEARLADIIENGSDADALRAIEAWTSRVYGRPTERVAIEPVEVPRTVEAIRSMTTEQRQALLRRLDERGMRLIEGQSED